MYAHSSIRKPLPLSRRQVTEARVCWRWQSQSPRFVLPFYLSPK